MKLAQKSTLLEACQTKIIYSKHGLICLFYVRVRIIAQNNRMGLIIDRF